MALSVGRYLRRLRLVDLRGWKLGAGRVWMSLHAGNLCPAVGFFLGEEMVYGSDLFRGW